ncbi:hypothetical protein HDV00_011693, partial [Rhizophlyctis rosea]
FTKSAFTYAPGQYLFICIPKLSPFEWHPFSISSSPHDPTISIHIRALGNWTRRVASLAATSDPSSPPPKIYIDGPYGEMTFPLEEYKNFIMISGGIGITPLQSVYNDLIYEWRSGRRELRHVVFVWSVREGGSYDYLLDAETQKKHRKENNLGVLPPFHTPMLLEEYESEAETPSVAVGQKQPTNEHPIINTLFYLTRSSSPAGGSPVDVEEGKKVWVRPGRADLDEVFGRVAELDGGEGRVAVLVCGPAGLVRDVRRRCREFGVEGVRFDLHEESFEL